MNKLNERRIPLSCLALTQVLRPNRTAKTDYDIMVAKTQYRQDFGCTGMRTEYEATDGKVFMTLWQARPI